MARTNEQVVRRMRKEPVRKRRPRGSGARLAPVREVVTNASRLLNAATRDAALRPPPVWRKMPGVWEEYYSSNDKIITKGLTNMHDDSYAMETLLGMKRSAATPAKKRMAAAKRMAAKRRRV